jgi:GT2 family glycosyltransferase
MEGKNTLPQVIVIVLNWNGSADTLCCLESLEKVTYPACEVLVVDNGSTDDSVAILRRAFPHLRMIETGQNLGFVGGNNVGLEYARSAGAEYALLLNNDTEVDADFLTHLVQAAESGPDVGITGPSIYYFDEPDTFWSAGGQIDWKHGVTSMVGINQVEQGQYGSQPRPVDFVTGCALLIKMDVVEKVGMLDPRFFLYYEETEWCVRVRRAGYEILHVPASKIWHKISPVAREASPMVHYYMTRNRLLFLRLSDASLVTWANTYIEYARTLLSWRLRPRWRGKARQRQAMLQAIRDFSRRRFGKVEWNGGV